MNASNSDDGDLAATLPEVMREAAIGQVRIEVVQRTPSFRGGKVSARVQEVTRAARVEHTERGFGFWEFALSRALSADPDTRRALIHGALRHEPMVEADRQELDVDDFVAGLRSRKWRDMPARTLVNLCSTVRRQDGTTAQLPMLDFGLDATASKSADAAVEALEELEVGGVLFTSGRSFHFLGDTLMSGDGMRRMLARAQLLSPLIDYRWVAHQLIDGESRLRISTDVERNPQPHRLVRHVHAPARPAWGS